MNAKEGCPGEGYVELVTTFLEMTERPPSAGSRPTPPNVELLHAQRPPIHYYRYLYGAVGGPWNWWERLRQDDATVLNSIHHPAVEIFVPHVAGVPAGLLELDGMGTPDVQLNYFGLIPDFIGTGLGGWLLDWGIGHVFDSGAGRFWLHTCNFDSPQAIHVYKRAGFRVYDENREWMKDPTKADTQAPPS